MTERNGHTNTQLIAMAVEGALAEQREALDAARNIGQVTIIVNYDARRGVPRKVAIRPELFTGSRDTHE
jgi:hypothetical protein